MGVFNPTEANKMLEMLLKQIEALINEHGSATVLREHLGLLRERIGALERECNDLRAKFEQAQAHAQDCQSRLDRFSKDNPKGLRCDACGSVDLVRTGSREDPTFADVGIKQAVMSCRVCSAVSHFTDVGV
jgi:hypothetical protein